MNIAVIGAGISGVSAAKILQQKGHRVVVFESNARPGGLIQCDWIEGNLFHKVGGHVFNAKNKTVSDWFWGNFNQRQEFIKAERNAKILLNGKLIGYPLENHLYALQDEQIKNIVADFLMLFKQGYKDPYSYTSFSEFLKGNFGTTLFELYFRPYNEKIWKTDLSTVPMDWLEGKLPMPDYSKTIVDNITRAGESDMVHSTFFYPKKGGSQFIVDRLAEGLTISAGKDVTRLDFRDEKWTVNGIGDFERIVYTGDCRKLVNIVNVGTHDGLDGLLSSLLGLRSNGTSNMLCYTEPSNLSWLYLPDPAIRAHRIIYTGNFSSANNANPDRPTCVVEFSGKVSEETMRDEIKLLPGNLTPIDWNHEPNSYVIQDKDTRSRIAEVKKALAPMGLFLLGRFAEWEYYNMDKAIEAAMQLEV